MEVLAPRFRSGFRGRPKAWKASLQRAIPRSNGRPWAHWCTLCPRIVLLTNTRSLVSIVDDDESVRESLPDLVRQFGFAARAFSSAEAFLASEFVTETSCLILDIAMPGMSGPDLQRELASRPQMIPIVFITASGDRAIRPRLRAQGAVECLFKPFSDAALLDALNSALRIG